MGTFRKIALSDLDDALFSMQNGRNRLAVYCFQQFAEKSAKALLEKKDPESKWLKSHAVEKIMEAYDPIHKTSDLADKARYLTGFYFDTRYPGDNYSEIVEAQVLKAHVFATDLDVYFTSELEFLEKAIASTMVDVTTLPKVNLKEN